MIKLVNQFINLPINFLFPRICLSCFKRNGYLCSHCLRNLPVPQYKCFGCGAKNPFGIYCLRCRRPNLPDKIIARFTYSGRLKEIIHQFKYEDAFALSKDLSVGLSGIVRKIQKSDQYVLSFIPLTNSRRRSRGYNQSELLAKEVASITGLKLAYILERSGQIETQVNAKTRISRKKNIKGVFQVKKDVSVPENIILIDDVVTTGATVEEATKVLKRAGAKKVMVAALAMK